MARVRSESGDGMLPPTTALGDILDKSTLQALALLVAMVAPIVAISFAMTSRSRPLKIAGYGLTAALMLAFALAAVAIVPVENDGPTRSRFLYGLLLLAAAAWAGRSALAAYRGK